MNRSEKVLDTPPNEVRVNVFCQPKGWLKEDLKNQFAKVNLPGIKVVTSDRPLTDADAWLALRPAEAEDNNDLGRTVICLNHALHKAESYRSGGYRSAVHQAAGLIIAHPEVGQRLQQAGVDLQNKLVLERPIGALSLLQPSATPPEKFTLGWFGRGIWPNRPEWMVRICRKLAEEIPSFKVLLVGAELETTCEMLSDRGLEVTHIDRKEHQVEHFLNYYHQLSCLAVSGVQSSFQLSMFEAIACGIPVVSTQVGYALELASLNPTAIRLGDMPDQLCAHVLDIFHERESLFEKRHSIAQTVKDWSLEDWMQNSLQMAAHVAGYQDWSPPQRM